MKTLAFATLLLLLGGLCVAAQDNRYPNELKGFEFFGEGSLKPLELGSSRKEDVEKIFGRACEEPCDYDANFKISFHYLSLDDCMTTQAVRDRLMCPLDEYLGTISSIDLKPNQPINFADISTSQFDLRGGGGWATKGGGMSVSYSSFGDKYGLKYSIYEKISEPNPNTPKFKKSDLYSVTYNLSEALESKIFRAEYKPRT
jgi:hypothetical protein